MGDTEGLYGPDPDWLEQLLQKTRKQPNDDDLYNLVVELRAHLTTRNEDPRILSELSISEESVVPVRSREEARGCCCSGGTFNSNGLTAVFCCLCCPCFCVALICCGTEFKEFLTNGTC